MDRDQSYLLDMLLSDRMALQYARQVERDVFLSDTRTQDAIIRRIEIIGEAAGCVSAETRSELSVLPWKSIVGMRNLVIHQYPEVDVAVIWDTVHQDLPLLIALIEPLVQEPGQ